ncbi:PilZ domain-containing protein [Moritella sp. Urea-trap-13]|uniref:PilZ domain-containing protein n=1 Tax=Moritella sp. Urea-trap-13 TaxID=2058327 RepID=UPI000C34EA7A|nr:PilZ domain-containing protein [Moritella sp. Urea-trap-13]PKH07611.1 PilZ domain-containing protein [Moritella sp. Urea-trap-13]
MPKKVSDVLTQDELNLLQEVIDSQIEHGCNDIVISDISKQLLNVLAQSADIVLVAQRQQEEFRFPLYLISDELKELGPPDIIDHKGGGGRYWRFADPKGLKIFDHKGDVLLGVVSNISTSGLFMLCSEQQFLSSGFNLKEGANMRFYLKIPQRGFHLVDAIVVRIESEKNNVKGLALKFNINDELTLILHDYIIEKHDSLHELE